MEQEQVTGSRRGYEGKRFNVRIDDIAFEDGRTGTREIVEYGPAVVMAPITDDGDLLLVRQYRRAIDDELYELPAGGINRGEDPRKAADRELREETGFSAGELIPLGGFYAAPGYSDEWLHLFVARNLKRDPLDPDEDESIDLVSVSLEEVVELIDSGEIRDAKSVAGILRVLFWMNEQGISLHDAP